MYAYFDRFTIKMTLEDAKTASHPGRCDEDVEYIRKRPKIARQLAKISNEDLRAELKEYGAWDAEELQDREDNERRIVWIAAGNIREERD